MEFSDLRNLKKDEVKQLFFSAAKKTGLVKDDCYIDGIPEGEADDVNDFYLLEDYLGYPKPSKIPKKYLKTL